MKKYILIFIILLGINPSENLAIEKISIFHNGCHYSTLIPENWDTIPKDVLKNKLGIEPDLGIYPTMQEGYSGGNYALISFIPTVNNLNKFTFDQIVSDITAMNKQGEINNITMKTNKKAVLGMLVAMVMSLGVMGGINQSSQNSNSNLQQVSLGCGYMSGETEGGASGMWAAGAGIAGGAAVTVGYGALTNVWNPLGWVGGAVAGACGL